MRVYLLVLGALTVWRVTHLLNAEDGPWKLLARFRERLGESMPGRLLDCFYCLSLWVAAPFAWLIGELASGSTAERWLLWPSLSGAACLLERFTDRGREEAPAEYFEDPE